MAREARPAEIRLRPGPRPKGNLQGSRAPRPGRRSRKRQPTRLLLGSGIALVVIGLLTACYRAVFPAAPGGAEALAEAQDAQDAANAAAEQTAPSQAEARVLENKFPCAAKAFWVEQPIDHAKERGRLLKSLQIGGRGPKFFPVWQLQLPADGKPVACYCLLYLPLDEATEEAWEKAGMLRTENERISPYLRYVVIDNQEARRELDSPFVDRLAYDIWSRTE